MYFNLVFWTVALESVTVTVHVPFLLEPSVDVAVMVVLPAPLAVTVPFETVATLVLELAQERFLLVALDGETVATIVNDSPFSIVFEVGETLTEVTFISVGV